MSGWICLNKLMCMRENEMGRVRPSERANRLAAAPRLKPGQTDGVRLIGEAL